MFFYLFYVDTNKVWKLGISCIVYSKLLHFTWMCSLIRVKTHQKTSIQFNTIIILLFNDSFISSYYTTNCCKTHKLTKNTDNDKKTRKTNHYIVQIFKI